MVRRRGERLLSEVTMHCRRHTHKASRMRSLTNVGGTGYSDTVSDDRVNFIDFVGGDIEVAITVLAPRYDVHTASVHVDGMLSFVHVVDDQLNDLKQRAR